MGMNLSVQSTDTAAASDQSWLGSAHGTDIADGITLDAARFLAAFADGKVPSGVVIARDATSLLGVPYNPLYDSDEVTAGAQPNGADIAIGHLLEGVRIDATTPVNVGAARFWHGQVIIGNLPAGSGYDADVQTDLPLIDYV